MPSDHLRLLIELLRPAGPELARRWLAALMLVPPDQRDSVVSAVEARIATEYRDANEPGSSFLTAIAPPVQRDGYVEHVETEYEVLPARREAQGWERSTRRTSGGH